MAIFERCAQNEPSIITWIGTIALVSDGGRAHLIIDFIYYEIYVPCETHMTIITTNFLNLPFVNEIMDAFKEYSNEYEFTAEGVFRRIKPPACPRCGKQMSHNGYNKYGSSLFQVANLKLSRNGIG